MPTPVLVHLTILEQIGMTCMNIYFTEYNFSDYYGITNIEVAWEYLKQVLLNANFSYVPKTFFPDILDPSGSLLIAIMNLTKCIIWGASSRKNQQYSYILNF